MILRKYGHIARRAKIIASLLRGDAADIEEVERIKETYQSSGQLHLLNIALFFQAQKNIRLWDDDFGVWHITYQLNIGGKK